MNNDLPQFVLVPNSAFGGSRFDRAQAAIGKFISWTLATGVKEMGSFGMLLWMVASSISHHRSERLVSDDPPVHSKAQ